jgi:regulator of replication initiation timing
MSSNYPSTDNYGAVNKKDNKNNIIILLAILLVASWAYFLFARKQSNDVISEKDAQYATLDSAKSLVQKDYDEAMLRIDDLSSMNSGLDSLVRSRDKELGIIKDKFKSLIAKQNATKADLEEAKNLVNELNGKISDYVKEIERLQAENRQLTTDKNNLTAENKNLSTNLANSEAAKVEAENKVDIGSTLHASGFKISAINVRNSGKEKATTSAKRADKLRVSFNLDENLIATSGNKQLYIIAKDPTGKVITEESLGSGKVGTRKDGQIDFTTKIDVDYKTGELKYVGFDLLQTDKYTKGNYSIVVYQNGFKIGEGIATLK